MPSTVGVVGGAGSLKDPSQPLLLGYKVNWIKNPSFETNTTGWSSVAGATLTRITSEGRDGSACLQVTNASASAAQFGGTGSGNMIPLVAGSGNYTISAYIKLGLGNTTANYFLRQLQYEDEASTSTVSAGNGGTQSLSYTGNWVRLTYTITKAAAANFLIIRIVTASTTPSETFLIDSVMVEKGSTASTYFDGSSGGFWTGAAHGSFSGASPY
jgi:hypothetical protein